MICGVVDDLINWRVNIFESDLESFDVHFLDNSFSSSYLQLENFANSSSGKDILNGEVEIF